MKKFAVLLICLALLWLTGCHTKPEASTSRPSSPQTSSSPASSLPSPSSEEEPDIKELKALLEELMPKSDEIRDIYSGGGLQADTESPLPEPDENGQQFVPVLDSRFRSLQDLTDYTESVYTREYAQENFYQYALEGPYIRYKEVDGVLCIDLNQGGGGGLQWNTATAEIASRDGNSLTVSMQCMDYYDGKYSGTVTLRDDGNGWRINALSTKDFAAE